MIELHEVSIREVQADEVRGAWLAAFFLPIFMIWETV